MVKDIIGSNLEEKDFENHISLVAAKYLFQISCIHKKSFPAFSCTSNSLIWTLVYKTYLHKLDRLFPLGEGRQFGNQL